jgi:hypothetical protein
MKLKKFKYKYDNTNLHRLIALTSALHYQLEQAEKVRKEIAKLSLKVRRKLLKNNE